MAKEKKLKAPRKPKQAKQEILLPPKIVEVGTEGAANSVQEKVVLPAVRRKIVPHELIPLVESLLIRVENLEKILASKK